MRETESGFQFPGCFEITAFADSEADFARSLPGLLTALDVAMTTAAPRTRASSAGRYQAITVSFLCPDRDRYDAVVAAVRGHPAVRWVL
ncbi:MAG: YbeD family protein [Lysobacterales bacterium]